MRLLTRVPTVVEALGKFFRECARLNPAQFEQINAGIRDRYIKREGSGCFSYPVPRQAKRTLCEVGADVLDVLKTLRGTGASGLVSLQLLERAFSKQFEVENAHRGNEEKLLIKEPKDVPCDGPSDPDSSYNAYHGQGYLVQVMETYCPSEEPSAKPDFITHIDVHKVAIGGLQSS